jgi:molybdate transport system permease protein
MLSSADLAALWLTLRLACTVTLLLFALGTPLAWWLARSRSRWTHPVAAVVALPLVLPPTVLGFYLLVAFGPHGPIGSITESLGLGLLSFTFTGLVLASMLYSMPFVIQPLRNAFESIDQRSLEVAATLGASPRDRFLSVAWPEFGVVLMIGGNIPGSTRVLSVQIFDHVEALQYAQAHVIAGGLLLFSFVVLLAVYGSQPRLRSF